MHHTPVKPSEKEMLVHDNYYQQFWPKKIPLAKIKIKSSANLACVTPFQASTITS